MLLESKAFLSNNVFRTDILNLLQIQTVINSQNLPCLFGLILGHFDIFDILFPFLSFVKL